MAGDDERSGPFEEHHTDEDILEYVEREEVVTTREVADHFEYHLQTARRRLKSLAEDGELNQKDVGKRYIWWVSRN